MPKAAVEKPETCTGGRSMGCKHNEHKKSRRQPDIYCQYCRARMGCFLCVQIPRELVCLNCHDWAHPAGLRGHGKMLSREQAAKGFHDLLNELPWLNRNVEREPGDDDN